MDVMYEMMRTLVWILSCYVCARFSKDSASHQSVLCVCVPQSSSFFRMGSCFLGAGRTLAGPAIGNANVAGQQYRIIENCSWGPFLELFGRGVREGWTVWGNQASDDYKPTWKTYKHNSGVAAE